MHERVAIIMSVYNGEKYLREQIDSLVNQDYSLIDIFIHDDGSFDSSEKIIEEYSARYSNIYCINEERNLGYPQCFIRILNRVSGYDYYAFADQDDVWFSNKIHGAVSCLNKYKSNSPVLYYTAVRYCDKELRVSRESRFASGKRGISQESLQTLLFGGEAMGMTFVFNNTAREELIKASIIDSSFKDCFLKLFCASCGSVFYNSKPSALYRRHNKAVTHKANPDRIIGRYYSQIRKVLFSRDGFENQKRFINYINHYSAYYIINDNKELIELFSTPNNLSKLIRKVLWPHRYRHRIIDEMGYRIAFLLGRI